ncbi:hypothetical protein ACFQFC_14335 [Amorphoplanes digitatis]|uniref:hypothetical protein n=1 Tax=Actinoplanes digitatis TaxID=1868 RepID=UPI0036219A5F
MSVIEGVTWGPLAFEDLRDPQAGDTELVLLARRCLDADGGLPLAADPGFLRGRWAAPGGRGRAGA